MTKVLMVCLGNICRSPLAHGILEAKLPNDSFYIDSAGTSNYHIGERPDPRSIEVAKIHGLDISHQTARQFTTSDFDAFDHIFVMDESNYRDVIKLARNEQGKRKVKLILNEDDGATIKQVPDPYYGGDQGFENVFQMLDRACDNISKKLLQ